MPILESEIKLFNTTSGLGGAITATEIVSNTLHNVFSKVNSDDALLGKTFYKCVYVKNTNGSITLENTKIYMASNTPSVSTTIEIGLGTSAINSTEQVIPNETTAPTGITFTALTGTSNALTIGNLANGSHKAVWLKLIVSAGTTAVNADGVTLQITGDTGA
jgi:hypothetical protein